MGEISDLMKWYENAHAKFEQHGAVILEERTSAARGGPTTKGRTPQKSRGTAFDRIVRCIQNNPLITNAEIFERVSASRSTVQHARAVLRGASWAKPPAAMRASVRAKRRGAK